MILESRLCTRQKRHDVISQSLSYPSLFLGLRLGLGILIFMSPGAQKLTNQHGHWHDDAHRLETMTFHWVSDTAHF